MVWMADQTTITIITNKIMHYLYVILHSESTDYCVHHYKALLVKLGFGQQIRGLVESPSIVSGAAT